jgi:hypothetical protein
VLLDVCLLKDLWPPGVATYLYDTRNGWMTAKTISLGIMNFFHYNDFMHSGIKTDQPP